ncbi:S-layer homology domain-containing protein [Paenibacillus humicola]|uniref:S-layer homology domain-containing protein n=1 Tax=Paenibacillus humicola TaxID=3110540 RepID=UPI00237AC3B2|nr:S-layer homology domain-containing protein [Paenibacillus humicola]
MIKRRLFILAALLLLFTAVSQNAWAFSDIKNDPNAGKIAELEKLGKLAGGGKDGKFNPNGKLTYAEGVTLIVRGLDLNIDNLRFIKEPKASDYYTKVKDNAWYSQNFIIAQYNGLKLPKDVNPNAVMTREQFAYHLFQAITAKGDFAFIEMYVVIKDEADVTKAYMDSIQKLLIAKIAELDGKQNFHPKQMMTRSTAAGWLYEAIQFVKTHQPIPAPPDQQPSSLSDVKLAVAAVNDKVNEVTVTATVPNPGYGFTIASISFEGKQAVIHLEPTFPQPGMLYPQHVAEVKQVTYTASGYTPVIADAGAGMSGSAGTSGSGDTPVSGGTADRATDIAAAG